MLVSASRGHDLSPPSLLPASCNHVVWDVKALQLASCDADGCVKIWDPRMGTERHSVDVGPHPANKLAFDRSGDVIAVASDDGRVKLINAVTGEDGPELEGHDDAVQVVAFDYANRKLLSGSSDKTFRMWCVPLARQQVERGGTMPTYRAADSVSFRVSSRFYPTGARSSTHAGRTSSLRTPTAAGFAPSCPPAAVSSSMLEQEMESMVSEQQWPGDAPLRQQQGLGDQSPYVVPSFMPSC